MSAARQRHGAALERAADRLAQSLEVSAAVAERICELAGPIERFTAATVINGIRPAPRLKLMLSGWSCEHRVLVDGRRQIFSFAVAGDVLQPMDSLNACALVAVTAVECLDLGHAIARASEAEGGEIAAGVERALSLSRERRYEQIARLRRRSALQRTAHLLLELHDRLEAAGLVEDGAFPLPLTQEHLADALGLSVVHVNRSLKSLREQGMATVRFGRVTQFNRDRLEEICRT